MVDSSSFSRREFLLLTAGTVLPWVVGACGDDGIGEETGGGSSSSGGEPTTGGGATGSTGAGEAETSVGSTGDASTGDATTGDATTGDATTGDETTGDTTTGEAEHCGGELIDFDADAVMEDLSRFPRAVLAGAMRPVSVVLCSHSGVSEAAVLRVWQPGERAGQVRLISEVELMPDEEGGLRHTVTGLCPGQWYRYGFFAGEDGAWTGRSILGEFRTALADDVSEALTVAISACNHIENRPWPALLTQADEYYDVFLHLGDMAYNDSSMDAAAYRASWHNYLLALQDGEASGMALAFARAGVYATLDDHEITNNFNPETIDPARLDAALRAYHAAIPLTDEADTLQVWRSFRWGRSVEFFVLDCRTERLPSTAETQNPIYVGPAQMQWLKDGLAASPCTFKVILNSVPITNMPALPWDVAANDRWEGYGVQRFELLDHIHTEDIRNVWFVSGDLHVCFVGRIEPGAEGLLGSMQEVAVTGGNTNVLGDFLPDDQYAFGSSRAHALFMTFDPEAEAVHVRFVDPVTGEDAYSETLTQR